MAELIGLISDMHGNGIAFDAALKDLERQEIDRIVCLGDAIQGGSQPAQVIERLRELKCPVVMGNSDSWVLTGSASEATSGRADEIGEWTRDQLGSDGLAFIQTFQQTVEIEMENGGKLLCFHGSPKSFDDVILPETSDEEVAGFLGGTDASVLAGGHVHLQWTRRVGDAVFFNPGSAGVAYNRHMDETEFYIYPFSEFAVLHTSSDQIRLEFCRVPFDVDELEKAAKASGRPYSDREPAQYRPR